MSPEPLTVEQATPNIRWSNRWVAIVPVDNPDEGPLADLHVRGMTDPYGLTTTPCGLRGRAIDLTDQYRQGHPVVGCLECFQRLPITTRNRHLLATFRR